MNKRFALFLTVCVLLFSACTSPAESTIPPEETGQTEIVETIAKTLPAKEAEPPEDESWDMLDAPESSCFTVIMYCRSERALRVQFRESGAWYIYYDFEPEMWVAFKNADSKGGFFNESIKGYYDYERK